MISIRSLESVDFQVLYTAFEQAFSDYEMQLNKSELKSMIERRGFVPELSFGAFTEEKLVSFTFNGIGMFNGLKTAYDTGTGTLKDFRGQGLATKVFNYSIPFLKNAGIEQYLLEVIQHNTNAVSLYKKIGFKISREFNYFIQKNDEISISADTITPESFSLKSIELSEAIACNDFHDFYPSWQNSFDSIKRKIDDFLIIGAFKQDQIVAYCVFEPTSGDLTQIAVDKKYRRQGIATMFLRNILNLNKHNSIKIINTETKCESISSFLESFGISINGKQYEMTKTL